MDRIKIWAVIGLMVMAFPLYGQKKEERTAIRAIKSGDIETLRTYLVKHSGPECMFHDGKSGLYYAIAADQFNVSWFLLEEDANPDHIVDGLTPLTWAAEYGRERIARLLIEYGAEVNWTDERGNTPLIYATQSGNLEMCRILVSRGADILHHNREGRRAIDYTGYNPGSSVYRYLQQMEELIKAQDTIPSMQDGPHIFFETEERIVLKYFQHIREKKLTRVRETTFPFPGSKMQAEGAAGDDHTYTVRREFPPDEDSIVTTGNVFALGDIHGRYHALVQILVNNGIVDTALTWTFGDGHLVFLGDIFDRGGHVTETLWLIYDLQQQAGEAGGEVHLLLGNHEVMTMTGDHRYLNEKYEFFSAYTGKEYYSLYDTNTVMGRWLRSRNVVLRINDHLFLHAGISPQLAIHGYSLSEINRGIRDYLHSEENPERGSLAELLTGPVGPLWYRGYGRYGGNFPEVTQEYVEAYLDKHGLERMILGHNELQAVSAAFDGKVISIDVAIDESGMSAQGLLISSEGIFICHADGKRFPLE